MTRARPAPDAQPDAAVEAFKTAWHRADSEGRAGERVREGLTAAAPHLTPEASRIAVLEARLAALGFPSCKCHPADDDSERCLPDPAQWIAEVRSGPSEVTRETIRTAIGAVLTDSSNYPEKLSIRILGHDLSQVIDQTTDAVVQLIEGGITHG